MATTIRVDEDVAIPTTIQSLCGFRTWATSDGFPDRDRSVVKDTRRLPQQYFQVGVTEFWLVDARRFRLLRLRNSKGRVTYRLEQVSSEREEQL
jgi:hypothetical protein